MKRLRISNEGSAAACAWFACVLALALCLVSPVSTPADDTETEADPDSVSYQLTKGDRDLITGEVATCGTDGGKFLGGMNSAANDSKKAYGEAVRNVPPVVRGILDRVCPSGKGAAYARITDAVPCYRDTLNELTANAGSLADARKQGRSAADIMAELDKRKHFLSTLLRDACGKTPSESCLDKTVPTISSQLGYARTEMGESYFSLARWGVLSHKCKRKVSADACQKGQDWGNSRFVVDPRASENAYVGLKPAPVDAPGSGTKAAKGANPAGGAPKAAGKAAKAPKNSKTKPATGPKADADASDASGGGLQGDYPLPTPPKKNDGDSKGDPFDATNGDFPIGGLKVRCPDFIPREACLAGGGVYDVTHYREATRMVTRTRTMHGEPVDYQVPEQYYKFEATPDVPLSSSTTLRDLLDGAYATVKSGLDSDLASFMADGYIESYLQSAKLNSATDDDFDARVKELRKAAACMPGADATITGDLKKLPKRRPETQAGYKAGMANASQCMSAILPRWSELRATFGMDVEIARPILKQEEIEKLPFGARHLVSGLTGLPVVRQILREVPMMTGFTEAQSRQCSFLQTRMNPTLSSDEQQKALGEVRSWPVSRMDYCMNLYTEFSLLTREMNDLYSRYPLIGERTASGERGYEAVSKAAGPANPAIKDYNLDFNRDFKKIYDSNKGQLRSCMTRLSDDQGQPQAPPASALAAVDKLVGDQQKPALGSIAAQIAKLCDADKRAEIVNGAVQDPAFMGKYFSCDRTLFNTLFAVETPRPSPLPRAVDEKTCRLRQASSWAVCRRYKDVVAGKMKSEAYGQMLQMGMDMLFVVAPGVGGFAPSAGRLIVGAGIGAGLGYVLSPDTEKLRDSYEGTQANFRAGYATQKDFERATDSLAALAARNPKVEAVLNGAVMGGAFSLFAGEAGAAGSAARDTLAANARAALRQALQSPETAAAAEQSLIAIYRALAHEKLFTGKEGLAAKQDLRALFLESLERRYPDVTPSEFAKMGDEQLMSILEGREKPPAGLENTAVTPKIEDPGTTKVEGKSKKPVGDPPADPAGTKVEGKRKGPGGGGQDSHHGFDPPAADDRPTPAALAKEAKTSRYGRAVEVDGAKLSVGGKPFKIDPFEYLPPEEGQTAKAMAEAELGHPLGEQIAKGGTRRVFDLPPEPGKPSRVVKVYDMTAQKGLTPEIMAKLIQRELAMEDFLVAQGFKVARIDRNPALLRRGIIVQERIEGSTLWHHLPDMYKTGDFPKVDAFMEAVKKFDSDFQHVNGQRYRLKMSQTHESGGEEIVQGIDLGNRYSNVLVDDAGNPILIDW